MMPHHNAMINVLSLTLHHHDHQHHGHQEHSRNILWPSICMIFNHHAICHSYPAGVLDTPPSTHQGHQQEHSNMMPPSTTHHQQHRKPQMIKQSNSHSHTPSVNNDSSSYIIMIQIQTSGHLFLLQELQPGLPPTTNHSNNSSKATRPPPPTPPFQHTAPSTHPGHQEEHILILVAITSNASSQHQHPAPPK